MVFKGLALLAAVTGPVFAAAAQEPLDAILDRGHVSQWLVCGPFDPDVEGGVAGALKKGEAPLGNRDFMAPVGGVARLLPRDQLEVKADDRVLTWRESPAKGRCLSLASLFAGAKEGVVYAAFQAVSPERRRVYFDVQSPLGVRVYLNGFPVWDIHAAPADACGVDRFLATFRAGLNLLVIEAPLADFDVLAQAGGKSAAALRAAGFSNRPLLEGVTAFELGARLLPAAEFAGIAYVPRLDSTGSFSGQGADLRQDAWLTLFNPSSNASPSLVVQTVVSDGAKPVRQILSPIPPETEKQALVSIPVSQSVPGQSLTVQVTLEHEKDTVQFQAAVNVLPPSPQGTVYVVTGQRYTIETPEDQRDEMTRRLAEFNRNLVVLNNDPKYGFDLGASGVWKPLLEANPEARKPVLDAVALLRCGTHAGYGVMDERIVGGETLARNLAYGVEAVAEILGDSSACYYLWNAPAVCPQTPQLLSDAGLLGIVSNLPQGGIPELFWHEAPDATLLAHRHKRSCTGPASVTELREAATLQRKELLDRGLNTDLFVIDSAVSPPEPFYLGACTALARTVPSSMVTGAGGRRFFEYAVDVASRDSVDLPVVARAMNACELGAVAAQPALKQAYAEVENLAVSAEKFATFAALLGAAYPEPDLDLAWRQLLYTGSPDYMGFAATPHRYWDVLAALREAAQFAHEVLRKATDYLAAQADTYSNAPGDPAALLALVVFNPSSWTRTDLCETELRFDPAVAGLTLLDKSGKTVPFSADEVERVNDRIARARVRFVARDVPSLGYATYYVQPSGSPPKPSAGSGAQIQNDLLKVLVDPLTGNIIEFTASDAGKKYNRGALNAVIALEEDAEKTRAGREFWTTSKTVRSERGPVGLVIEKADWGQVLTISSPFAEGSIVRKLTLYNGIPRLYCETRLEGVRMADRILAVTFELDGAGRVPVFGERFGMLVGRKSRGILDFRTEGAANPSGTGAQPALRWAALSPNDHIEAGRDAAVPLLPCAIIYGEDSRLIRAARDVQTALVGRGIPGASWPDVPRKLDPVWSDSTEYPNFDDDLDHGTGMRIIIGSQEQNVFCRHLLLRLPEDVVSRFNERLNEGAALFLYDDNVPEGYPPVPTLILAGQTGSGTAAMAGAFAEAIAANGVYAMSPQGYVPETGAPQPDTGLAILRAGAFLHSVENDGTMVLMLAHGSSWNEVTGDVEAEAVPDPQTHEYVLYPFEGTWRDAGVVRAAHACNEPFVAVLTTAHLGAQPREQSFLAPEHLGFVVTAVKPAGYALAGMQSKPANPRDGVAIRGYESLGRTWHADMAFFTPIREASLANLLDKRGGPLVVEKNRVTLAIGAGAVETLVVTPAPIRSGQGSGAALGNETDPGGPVFTRYWSHNRGAAPWGFQPVSVLLQGRLTENEAAAEVVVANNATDETISGTVAISASEGWNVAPAQFDYALPPGECQVEKAAVLRSAGDATTGGVIARTTYRGRTYLDVLALDRAPLSVEAARSGREIRLVVQNKGALPAEGYAEVIVPSAYWPECAAPGFPTIAPGRLPVTVPPFREQEFVFLLSAAQPTAQLVAKVAANGHVLYVVVPK